MEYIVIIIIVLITILLLGIGLKIRFSDMKKLKEIGFDEKLNELTNVFPENEEIAKKILAQLGHEQVKIKQNEDQHTRTSFYFVMTNTISIANLKDTFTRVQTIAHEVVHSTQNKTILWFNFLFSNVYIFYFFVISIANIINLVKYPVIHVIALILMGFIYYIVRSYLEMDAMIKAKYVAKEYMENSELIEKEKMDIILDNYDEINKIGIKLSNFGLACNSLIKVIIFCFLTLL